MATTTTTAHRASVASSSSLLSNGSSSFRTARTDSARNSQLSLASTAENQKHENPLKDAVDVQIVKVSADLGHPVFKQVAFPGEEDRPSSLDTTRPTRASTSTLRPTVKSQVPPENLLHPPPPLLGKPARRNTTGSAPRPTVVVKPEDDLMSDISAHAELIRKERLERRQHQLSTHSQRETFKSVAVGNLIGEDHVNYILMYNMLAGIRTCVSRCQAKIKRPLAPDDFTASHKYTFDIIGNELTPSAKYDCKFKDYAPWVFRELRESYFHLDPADYLVSLTGQYILSELGSPGKSGSFFYFSKDYRFIIKTIHPAEHGFLLKVLPKYHAHVQANPHTLISRFYGLHRVKLPRGRKIHFVIMNNLFPPHKDIHETYDLKGSTVGRLYPWDKAKEKGSGAVLKDLNWIEKGHTIELGPEKRALLTEQLRRDKEFLKEIKVMDYSLLIGIHNLQRGNRDKLRKNTLKVYSVSIFTPESCSIAHLYLEPELPRPLRRSATSTHAPLSPHNLHTPPSITPDPETVRKAVKETPKLQPLGKRTVRLPKELITDAPLVSEPMSTSELSPPLAPWAEASVPIGSPGANSGESSNRTSTLILDSPGPDSRAHFLFYQDEGGLRATDETNHEENVIYYLGEYLCDALL